MVESGKAPLAKGMVDNFVYLYKRFGIIPSRNRFLKTGKFWEKYDVVKCDIGKADRYPTQTGFGWTNAIFVRLAKEFL